MSPPLSIRAETEDDHDGVRRVHLAAFGREAEGEIVDRVRASAGALLSLVALLDARVVGHVLFSPVTLDPARPIVGLGPLAVHPEHQGLGIGSALVREGLSRLRSLGYPAVVVLGDPSFYRRFGFRPASVFGVRWERPAPDEVFQALELRAGALAGGGIARYHAAFAAGA